MRHPFLRTLAGTTTDPNFENVTLLLHGDGTNGGQNNTFVDGSTNNFSITRNGNTTQGTFSPYGDNWSNYFDGTGDYLTAPANSALTFGTGDFTYELWVFHSVSGSAEQYADQGNSGFSLAKTSADKLSLSHAGVATLMTSSGTIPTKQWAHVAISRSGTSVRMFINGVLDSTSTLSTNFSSTTTWFIGRQSAADAARINGYISNLRAVKGTAVYTAAFTPQTTPLTAITNTSLLTCQSNRFRDASTNNFTITRNGDVSVQRFSPFSPTAAYAAGTIGGSGYFDGTGDYLQLTGGDGFNLTGDFTVEAWIYRTTSGSQRIVGKWNLTGNLAWVLETSTTAIGFGVANSGTFSASLSFSATINLFAWNHVAVSRSGSTVRAFLNGVDLGSATSSANCTANNTNPIQIGQTENVNYVNGYVCDVRVLKGTAQYTAAFTPPTAPLTAITNTSLLLNFTNAAILDNAMMAVPETVGNAQISTSVKKYGTGSLYFDGTGDYLQIAATRNLNLSSGDWTVECWWNPSANVAQNIVMVNYNAGTDGYAHARISTSVSPNTFYALSSSTGTSWLNTTGGGSWSINNWYHLAFVRNGSTFTLFVNGTSVLSYTSSSTLFAANGISEVGRTSSSAGQFYYVNGYIDDLRITKGVARYTANFTAPTAAFPDL